MKLNKIKLPLEIINKIMLYNSTKFADELKPFCKNYQKYCIWCKKINIKPEPFFSALKKMLKIDNKYNRDYMYYCKWYSTNSIDNNPDNYFVFFLKTISVKL